MIAGLLVTCAVLALRAPAATHAATSVPPPCRMVPPSPYRPKEMTMLWHQGSYHLFYMRLNVILPFDSTTRDLGHTTSGDLIAWEEQPVVLDRRPTQWDNMHIWAPSLLVTDSLFYLFYTGVTYQPPAYNQTQRIGIATSKDLYNWTRYPQPIFDCSDAPWTFCNPHTPWGGNFRDPIVIPHPSTTGHWLMYYGAMVDSTTGQMMIGVAESDGDLFEWEDRGPLLNTGEAYTYGRTIESPAFAFVDGTTYLFYTTESGLPINYQTTTNLLGPPSQWTSQRRLEWEVPNTSRLFGCEFYVHDGETLFMAANDFHRSIDLYWVEWGTAPHFAFETPMVTAVKDASEIAGGPRVRVLDGAFGSGRVEFQVEVSHTMTCKLDLFDVSGRHVKRLLDRALPPGSSRVSWNGELDGGAAAAGLYLARLSTPVGSSSARALWTPGR
ncbi:MAG: family 43 glycosylhydrolase [Candidatus Eisenbacteria bacterium]|uniref:beta-fructofuranosidase n=1 Tax=Eiseniibacteriota bacterium TaxID=2212470 RepID=A0A849T243_UNCEI|nr:family 43 glycosylhydrolase [Candidatus Eisenbacteria bacterium]